MAPQTPKFRTLALAAAVGNLGNNLFDTCGETGHNPSACHPGRLCSLWDVMNIFLAHELVASTRSVLYWNDLADYMRSQQRGADKFNDASYKLMIEGVVTTRDACFRAGFVAAAQKIGLIHQRLDADRSRADSSYLAGELNNVWDAVLEPLVHQRFLRVNPVRSVCVDNPNLMGPQVLAVFPDAKADIVEAGNCLAAECNTAAAFHLMRVFEWGIRTFAADLGLKRFKDWSKGEQRFKHTPPSFAIWEKFITELPKKIETRLKTIRKGALKQKRQVYYYSVYDDIKVVKEAWRNHVMHTRQSFNHDEANALFMRVKDIMVRMAEKP